MDVTEPNAVRNPLPDHVIQGVTVQTVDSLVDYTNRFKTGDTALFADIAANRIVSALDYHQGSKIAPGADDKAGPDLVDAPIAAHGDHSAVLSLPFSVEWQTWTKIHGQLMPQLEFARFLEENAADIAAPAGADLLDACRDLQAVRTVNFKKAVRTATDNESFEYNDDTEARTSGGLELPTKFMLSIPVYFGGANTTLFAFLRWKLEAGSLRLGVALHRAEHVRQAVFKEILLDVADRTERPAVFGKLDG